MQCTCNLDETNSHAVVSKKPVSCILQPLMSSGMSEAKIMDEVISFLIVGYDSVRVAIDMVLFQLALHPEYQQKCQEEVDQMFSFSGYKDDDDLCFGMPEIAKLKYLKQCVLESLRLTPSVAMYSRELLEPLKVSEDWTMKAGEFVTIVPWAIHRSPRYYPNPRVFDPDRFLPEGVKKRHPYSFIPFSMGERNCIGSKVAVGNIKVIVAWILRHFTVSTMDRPEDVKMYFDVAIRPERQYNLTYHLRDHN